MSRQSRKDPLLNTLNLDIHKPSIDKILTVFVHHLHVDRGYFHSTEDCLEHRQAESRGGRRFCEDHVGEGEAAGVGCKDLGCILQERGAGVVVVC